MSIEITTSGYIEVFRDGVFVSRHTVETKAVEAAIAHADEHGDGDYEIRFPRKQLVSRLKKTVVPFTWSTITCGFVQGAASSVELAQFLANPQARPVTYGYTGTLPTGLSLNTSTGRVTYNGTSPVATASVQFTATWSSLVAKSSAVAVEITAPAVTDHEPTWSDGLPSTFSVQANTPFTYTFTANDVDGDAIAFLVGAHDPLIQVEELAQVGNSRNIRIFSAGLPAPNPPTTPDSYSVTVDLSEPASTARQDWERRIATPGVMWYHAFDSQGEIERFYNPAQSAHVTRPTSGGPGDFPYLRIRVPAGAGSGNNSWKRPFAALPADAWGPQDPGYTHPYAGGADQWSPTTSSASYLKKMVYGHPDYWPGPTAEFPTAGSKYAEWQAAGPGSVADPTWFAGHDFWLSFAFRTTSSRWQPNLSGAGKFHWFTVFNETFGGGEMVFRADWGNGSLHCYQGAGSGDFLGYPQDDANDTATGKWQKGSQWENTCLTSFGWYNSASAYPNNCWRFPSWPGNVGTYAPYTTPTVVDESKWTHFLYYWKLGHRSPSLYAPYDPATQDTTCKIWINNETTNQWMPLYQFTDRAKTFDTTVNRPFGLSYFTASCYLNYEVPAIEWGNDYAQMIFKRGNGVSDNPETDGIPAPQVA